MTSRSNKYRYFLTYCRDGFSLSETPPQFIRAEQGCSWQEGRLLAALGRTLTLPETETGMSNTKAFESRSRFAGPFSPVRLEPHRTDTTAESTHEFELLVRRQLELLGEDPDRDGILKTPERVAKSLRWLTRGYDADPRDIVGVAIFEEHHENMVMVRDIELYSMCEHHMLPFFGKAHIAYIPNGRIVGLSKLPRIVDAFARRLQVQERLTEQIAQAIEDVLTPRGVGVVIEASHLCMMMRGVEKQNSKTTTSALRGDFRTCAMTRDEFLRLAYQRS